MRIAYIAGPYRAETEDLIQENIDSAKAVAKYFWSMGFGVICPHMNSAHFSGVVQEKNFLEAGLEMVSRLKPGDFKDTLVALPRWEESEGSKVEIALAKNLSITVLYITEDEFKSIWEEYGTTDK